MRRVLKLPVIAWKTWANLIGLLVLGIVAVVLADVWWLKQNLPDFESIAEGPVPASRPILEHGGGKPPSSIEVWDPRPLSEIPEHLQNAVILSEDVRFWKHRGVDLAALGEAIQHNLDQGRLEVGGSTISQQTVKNLYFSFEKTFLRKWHELVFTLAMERSLSKDRILEIYLNIAQFGENTFGVAAATRRYYGTPLTMVTQLQAAELAATLPSPTRDNPATGTRLLEHRRDKVLRWLDGDFSPLPRTEPAVTTDTTGQPTTRPAATHAAGTGPAQATASTAAQPVSTVAGPTNKPGSGAQPVTAIASVPVSEPPASKDP